MRFARITPAREGEGKQLTAKVYSWPWDEREDMQKVVVGPPIVLTSPSAVECDKGSLLMKVAEMKIFPIHCKLQQQLLLTC